MRHVAGCALWVASVFLAIMAILIGSGALFYITTALIATLLACRLQSYLAVRGLRLERVAPESVRIGEMVTVEVTVWSEVKIPRPLIGIQDDLPGHMSAVDISPSLPIAPSVDQPIRSQYRFRPMRRGKYRWSGVTVVGTDALGLTLNRRHYETSVAEMVVLPRPIPVSVELPLAAGWGISEAESGQTQGVGLDPCGIREYHFGDSLRRVHWLSTARTGTLLVKEFEAGSQAAAAFILQRTKGTDVGHGPSTTLEAMCGHTAYLAESFLRRGVKVFLPGLDDNPSHHAPQERGQEIGHALATIEADHAEDVSVDVLAVLGQLPPGSVLFVLSSVADDGLPDACATLSSRGVRVVPLLYDAMAYLPPRTRLRGRSAMDASFIERLEMSGAHPVGMPNDRDREVSVS